MILAPGGGPIYRGMRNLSCYDRNAWVVNMEAYFRREVQDADGILVKKDPMGVSVASEKIAVFARLSPKGIAEIESMTVRKIRNEKIGQFLEILADPPNSESRHGNIVEIPYLSEDRETAEFLAGELARNSALVSDAEFRALKELAASQGAPS